jgi:ankyrin repeat protein
LAAVKLLLRSGSEINAKSSNKSVPLHWGAWAGAVEVVELLLSHGADIMAKADNPTYGMKSLPEDWARKRGHTGVVQMLRSSRV